MTLPDFTRIAATNGKAVVNIRVVGGINFLLIALIILGIIGAASVRVLISQTRYYDVQLKKRSARSVSRTARWLRSDSEPSTTT